MNADLYDVIARIYACEARREEAERFVGLARGVYRLNDRRAVLKRQINLLLGSRLVEEKGHDLGLQAGSSPEPVGHVNPADSRTSG